MDGDTFDRWARRFSASWSRRRAASALVALVVAPEVAAVQGRGRDKDKDRDRDRDRDEDDEKTCRGTRKLCGRRCVKTLKDPRNCGGCGQACGNRQTCEIGKCRSLLGAPCESFLDCAGTATCDEDSGGSKVCCLYEGGRCASDADCCGNDRCASGFCERVIPTPPPPPPLPQFQGSGDTVTAPARISSAIIAVDARFSGRSNFIVWAHLANGDRDLLFNEIGAYQGTAILDPETATSVVFEVTADGPWSLSLRYAFV